MSIYRSIFGKSDCDKCMFASTPNAWTVKVEIAEEEEEEEEEEEKEEEKEEEEEEKEEEKEEEEEENAWKEGHGK